MNIIEVMSEAHYRLQSRMLMRMTTILGFQPLWLADCLPHHLANVLRLDCLDGGLERWLGEASCQVVKM